MLQLGTQRKIIKKNNEHKKTIKNHKTNLN